MVKIIVAGDFCPFKFPLSDKANFDSVSSIVKNADYSIVNLECPIRINVNGAPIKKIGPSLYGTRESLSLLKHIGFQCVTLANNHFKDYGEEGCLDTIQVLKEHNVDYVGAGANLQVASEILYKEFGGHKIAIINCCEHEFSIATEMSAGSNPMHPISIYYSIIEAKKNADFVFVITHGGVEMYNLPTPRMQSLYRYFIDVGADLVINHHQHCFSGFEDYKGKRIYYGLGNFYFPAISKDSLLWQSGYLVKISIDEGKLRYEEIPYHQSYENGVCVDDTTCITKEIKELNRTISDEKLMGSSYEALTKCDKYGIINPYNNRLLRGLARRGLLPSMVSKQSLLELYAKINCESHNDRFLKYLEKIIKK